MNIIRLHRTGKLFLLGFLLAIFFPACQQDNEPIVKEEHLAANEESAVPLEWMKLYVDFDRYAKGYRPGPSPRAMAYINLAAYEAAMFSMPNYKSLEPLYEGLDLKKASTDKEYHWPTVVNATYATMMKHFFPGHILLNEQQANLQFRLLNLESNFNEEFKAKMGTEVFNRSVERGVEVAEAFWDWSTTDTYGHDAYLNARPNTYTPPQGPGLWQPTAPDYGKAMFPYWGEVRTFAIHEEDKLARPPIEYSDSPSSLFYNQAQEVYLTVNRNDFTENWIAQFWSDDQLGVCLSPPARWMAIASQVLELENASLEKALYTYAKVSMALNDAGVACWHSKYHYNIERPISYINRVIDPNWQVHYLGFTPAFPAYPSGHSTFGAAAAEVLSDIFGYNYAMTDRTHEDRTDFFGMPRTFSSFYEMAEENAYSRIPLGVHFRMDAEEGVRMGYDIGRKVNGMPFK
ncbi:MAG: vanadium-dependent haloperoxidase [Saprospiraceae bacterium]|nr:vanadium-dependent haloperoxidase [Saprospiraceae bacterium]